MGHFRTPVTNFFLMLYLSSRIPDLDHEYLFFCDVFFLLRPLEIADARKVRYLQDLSEVNSRGRGLWRDSLWRTYDLLRRLGYPGYHFETQPPIYLRRRWVFEAYCEFRDFITEDRWYEMLGPTAILNHAYRQHRMPLVHLETEGLRAGFWGKPPADRQTVVAACRGRAFLNFDDHAFGPVLHRYLAEQFPTPSCYERPDNGAEAAEWIAYVGVPST